MCGDTPLTYPQYVYSQNDYKYNMRLEYSLEDPNTIVMGLRSSAAGHPDLNNKDIGETNVPMLRLNVRMRGALSPLSLTSITFDDKGSPFVVKASLYYSTSDTFRLNTATYLGELAAPTNGQYTFNVNRVLAHNHNYFYLLYDISPYAYYGTMLDAKAVSFTLSNNMTLTASGITTPDPEGFILVEDVATGIGNGLQCGNGTSTNSY